MIAAARELYAHGRIDERELDQYIEQALLREAGRDHPVPDGWEPLAPCQHDWVDATPLGSPLRQLLCTWCTDTRLEPYGFSP